MVNIASLITKRSLLIASGIVFIVISGLVFFGEFRGEPKPRMAVKLSVPISRQDFGQVGVNESRTAQYLITNDGTESVRILKWHPNCACVGYESDTPVIDPTRTAKVTVTWKFGKDIGEVVDSIGLTLAPEGEEEPSVSIHLFGVATVTPDYVIEPHTVAISNTPGDPAVARLRCVLEQGITISGAGSSNPMLKVSVVANEIHVTSLPGAVFDKGDVVVVTSSARQPTTVLTVTSK